MLWPLALSLAATNLARAQSGIGWVVAPTATGIAWPYQTFVTEPKLQLPAFVSNRTGPVGEGSLFMALQTTQQSQAVIVSSSDALVWDSGLAKLINLTPGTLKGQPVMLAWNGTALGDLDAYGSILIYDDTYSIIHNVKLQDPIFGNKYSSYADSHEAYLTDQGTVMVTAVQKSGTTNLTSVGGPSDGYIWDCFVFEIDVYTNEIIFRWQASQHPETIPLTDSRALPLSGRAGNGSYSNPWDPYHLNSIQALDDGYLVSLRHTSSIYHLAPNGSVTWQLHGDNSTVQKIQQFDKSDNTTFRWQHDARIVVKNNKSFELSLVDNNNWLISQHNITTGLVLAVDVENWTVKPAIRLSDKTDEQITFAGGNLQALGSAADDHWLMDYGFVPIIKEFDAGGRCVWTLQVGPGGGIANYRAYRAEWHAYPKTKPKVSACRHTDPVLGPRTRVYASWNGATDVTAWNIKTGNSSNCTQSTQIAKKISFETFVEIPGSYNFIQVESIGGGRPPIQNVNSVVVAVNCTCT